MSQHYSNPYVPAPELDVVGWLNVPSGKFGNEGGGPSIASLKGKVVVLHAFQMLCPGCVSHGIPQTKALYELYREKDEVEVIGLHAVFEHHQVMNPAALEAFVHEYRLMFPIAIDRLASGNVIPETMNRYQLQGTPSLVVIDHMGRIRLNYFGRMPDLNVGNFIGKLAAEASIADSVGSETEIEAGVETGVDTKTTCSDNGCLIKS